MKTYAIYVNGRNIDVYRAWSSLGAINAFIEDYPVYDQCNLCVMEIYVV